MIGVNDVGPLSCVFVCWTCARMYAFSCHFIKVIVMGSGTVGLPANANFGPNSTILQNPIDLIRNCSFLIYFDKKT